MRNGQRWRVVKVDDTAEHPRIAARRLGDGAWAVFSDDYLREQVQLGHAVTVHAAQGVTADTTHSVLADTASRNLAYVALTRGRASNHAYLYQRDPPADTHHIHNQAGVEGVHLARRGTPPTQAARALRQVIGRDEAARTAHQIAAGTPPPSTCPSWSHHWLPNTGTRSPAGVVPTRKPNAHNVIGN